jgi:hypothetical protein
MNTYNPNLREMSETTTALNGEVPNPFWVQFPEDVIDAYRQIALQSKTILVMEDVAEILHCAVSTVQNLSIDDLPTYEGAGRCSLYLRSDVEAFVKSRKRVVKRGTGLGNKNAFVIEHDTKEVSGNPARRALRPL